MKHLALITALSMSAIPAAAQESDVQEGFDLLGEGARLMLRGLLNEMEPALEELRGTIQGLDQYHAPEVLPNGDIIIRRKQPGERAAPGGIVPLPEDGTEVEI